MTFRNTFSRLITTQYIVALLVLLFLSSSSKIYAQEKTLFLQHRYDGVTEIITKTSTNKSLKKIQQKFESQGIYFKYKHIHRNKKNEITKINITIRNNISSSSTKWNNNNKVIPSIKVGEINGIVIATSSNVISLLKKE